MGGLKFRLQGKTEKFEVEAKFQSHFMRIWIECDKKIITASLSENNGRQIFKAESHIGL